MHGTHTPTSHTWVCIGFTFSFSRFLSWFFVNISSCYCQGGKQVDLTTLAKQTRQHVRFETAPTILVGARRGKPRAKRPHKAATAKSECCVCAENMTTFPFFLKKTNRQSPSQSQHLLLYSTSPLFCIPYFGPTRVFIKNP